MIRLLLAVIILSTISTGCHLFGKRVRGNGQITSEDRNVTGFTSVDVSNAIDVYIKQDSVAGVKVETDVNLQQHVSVKEEGGVLYIEEEDGYNLRPTHGIKVYVSGASFRKFSASGSCDIYTQNQVTNTESIAISLSGASDADMDLNAPRVKASLTGAGTIKLKGQTKDLELDGTGSSDLKCMDMQTENADVDITGSGSAEVFASVKLDVSVTGSGSVKYKGSPAVSQKVSGSGSVKKID